MSKSVNEEIKKIDNLTIRKMISLTKRENIISVTPAQAMIIKFLSENDLEVCQKNLGDNLPFRKSTICGIIKTMEKNNIIKLINSENDLRSKHIILTDTGKEINSKLEKCFSEFEKLMVKNISKEDLEIFFKVTNQIQNNLKGESDDKII